VRAGLLELAKTWFVIASQSFGGGPSTLYLMRELLVRRHRWISDREFLEDWVLSKLSLGIGFIAMTGLIGRRIAGNGGIVVSVLGLLLPAASITLLMTVAYEVVQEQPWLIAAFSGVGPVTAGMLVGIAVTLGRQSVRRGRRGLVDVAYWCLAGAAVLVVGASPVQLIAAGLVVGATMMRGEAARAGNAAT
jgi:chromate transport protein ChrA